MDNEKIVATEETVATEAPVAEAAVAEEKPAKAPYRQNAANRKRRKVCVFCVEDVKCIDYKDANKLRKFTSERSKILPRRVSGNCALHQRQLTVAIKRARQMALLPYVSN